MDSPCPLCPTPKYATGNIPVSNFVSILPSSRESALPRHFAGPLDPHSHTHTHEHTYTYVYIYSLSLSLCCFLSLSSLFLKHTHVYILSMSTNTYCRTHIPFMRVLECQNETADMCVHKNKRHPLTVPVPMMNPHSRWIPQPPALPSQERNFKHSVMTCDCYLPDCCPPRDRQAAKIHSRDLSEDEKKNPSFFAQKPRPAPHRPLPSARIVCVRPGSESSVPLAGDRHITCVCMCAMRQCVHSRGDGDFISSSVTTD